MEAVKKVAVIIVNYNAGELLAGNLRRIVDSAGDTIKLHLFIVDNQSTDGSFDALKQRIAAEMLSETVTLILAEKNGGFAYGNNVGLKAALDSSFSPDYFYLLNPDAYTLPKAIDQLIAVSSTYMENCLLGSTLHNEALEPRTSAFRLPSIISEFQRGAHIGVIDRVFSKSIVAMPLKDTVFECDWVSGAGFFFSRDVFNKIGYMDDGYFLYYEEVDYMHHAKKLGVKILSVPESKIVHIAGVSTQIVGSKTENKPMPIYWYNSWHRFYFKNFTGLYAICCGLAWIKGRLLNNFLAIFITHRKAKDGHSIIRFFKYGLLGKTHG